MSGFDCLGDVKQAEHVAGTKLARIIDQDYVASCISLSFRNLATVSAVANPASRTTNMALRDH
jgi:hypothetical protein